MHPDDEARSELYLTQFSALTVGAEAIDPETVPLERPERDVLESKINVL